MARYRKTILILSLMLSVTTFSILARNQQDGRFTNIQVFPKNISQERMDKEMDLFSKSLGVDCGYCHVRTGEVWDFASDKNHHKKEARDMMRMTNEINQKYFGEAADSSSAFSVMNCYSCHRGEEYPLVPWDTSNVRPKPAPVSPWPNRF